MTSIGRLVRTPDLASSNVYSEIAVAAKTVGTTAVLLATGSATMTDRRLLVIHNNSSAVVYVGPSGVTTSNGMPVAPSDRVFLPVSTDVYAIAGATGNDVRIMEAK